MRFTRRRGFLRYPAGRVSTMNVVDRLEAEGVVLVIRPSAALSAKRTESDVRKLEAIYARGYADAAGRFEALRAYLTAD